MALVPSVTVPAPPRELIVMLMSLSARVAPALTVVLTCPELTNWPKPPPFAKVPKATVTPDIVEPSVRPGPRMTVPVLPALPNVNARSPS